MYRTMLLGTDSLDASILRPHSAVALLSATPNSDYSPPNARDVLDRSPGASHGDGAGAAPVHEAHPWGGLS
jgi:hypothetical protein